MTPCTCESCGAAFDASALHRRFSARRCVPCQRAAWKAVERETGARRAMKAVYEAIRRGAMQPPTDFDCRDCGEPAHVYDHRDYGRPLQVEPVCRLCNQARGPAHPARREREAA